MTTEQHLYAACIVCDGDILDRMTPTDEFVAMSNSADKTASSLVPVLHQYHCTHCGVRYEFVNDAQMRKAELIAQILDRSHPLPDDALLTAAVCQDRGRLLQVLKGATNDELTRYVNLERSLTVEFVLKTRREQSRYRGMVPPGAVS